MKRIKFVVAISMTLKTSAGLLLNGYGLAFSSAPNNDMVTFTGED